MLPGMMMGMFVGGAEIAFKITVSQTIAETGSGIRTQTYTCTATVAEGPPGPYTYIWSWGLETGYGDPMMSDITTAVAKFSSTYSTTNPDQFAYTGRAYVTVTHTATGAKATGTSNTQSFITNQNA